MRISVVFSMALLMSLVAAGCGSSSDAGGQAGGTITVGEVSWELIPAIQCSIYPGDVVNIAGFAASDPDLEIVIDYNGPTGVRIGGERGLSWYAMKDTLKVQIEGKRVQGSATFNTDFSGTGQSAAGSFDVNCG